jgi:hypothetical protein
LRKNTSRENGVETRVLGPRLNFRGSTCEATHPYVPNKEMSSGEGQRYEVLK